MKGLFALFGIISLVSFSWAQKFDCPSLDGYDITNLTKPTYWQFDLESSICIESTESPCHFYFTFCKFLPPTENTTCLNSSVCQFSSEATNPLEIGHYVQNPFIPKETNGFFADFEGPKVSHKGKLCNVSIRMEFDCNSDQPWIPESGPTAAPNPVDYKLDSATCQYYLKFDYAGACHKIVPPSTKTSQSIPTITTTPINPTPAKICKQPDGYDITPLIDPPYWKFDITDGCYIESNVTNTCKLYMAFCKPIESLNGCVGSSVCLQYNLIPPKTVVAGGYTEDPFTSFKKNAFLAQYSDGEEIINPYTGRPCKVEIEVKFECDKTVEWKIPEGNEPGIAPFPSHFSPVSDKTCKLKMTVPYKGACSNKSGLSFGSVLIILIFVFGGLYLGFGFAYQVFIKNETGLNRIPNYQFWSFFALSAFEGSAFVWKFITCQSKKEKLLKYDSI